MKLLKTFIITWAFTANAGLPPTTLSGEQHATKPTTFTTVTPNYQATQVSGTLSRIETGNTNLLNNPSFEHSTFSTGWTKDSGVWAQDTTNVVEGRRAISGASSAGSFSIQQTSTLNAAKISGLQMMASVYMYTDDATLQVCAIINSVDTNCVTPGISTTFKLIQIPFIAGGTNNGIRVKTSSGTMADTHIDNAFVGLSAPFQNVAGAKFLGSVTISGCTADYTGTSTTLASFSAATNCTVTTAGQASNTTGTGTISTTPKIQFANMPAGDYRIEAEGRLGQSVTGQASYFKFSDGTNTSRELSTIANGGNSIYVPTASHSFTYTANQTNVTWDLRYLVSSGGTAFVGNQTVHPLTIKVWYFPPESRVYSQASQDYDWTAYTPTSPNSSFGTLSNTNCYHKRKGSDLFVKCNFTPSARNATEAQISLPNSLVPVSTFPTIAIVGSYALASTDTGGSQTVLLENNKSYFTYGYASSGSLTKRLASNIGSASTEFSFFTGPIPIQGWQDYGVIVGSFAGLEKCANDYECIDTFSAKVGITGIVTDENVDWINGNCSLATNVFTCTYNTNLKDGVNPLTSLMNCTTTQMDTGRVFTYMNAAGPTNSNATRAIIYENITTTNASASDTAFVLKCQKAGQDYKPKTAKIASSIGVPTVPGILTTGTGNTIDTFSVTWSGAGTGGVCSASPCTVDQIGTNVPTNGFTRSSAGTYVMNLSKTYSKLKCIYNQTAPGVGYGWSDNFGSCSGSCSSFSITSASFTTVPASIDTKGTIMCQGSY